MSYLTGMQRAALYALKRQYGEEVTVCKLASVSVDPKTGVKTQYVTETVVDRAIVLPTKYTRQEKNHGTFDVGACDFILDRSDLDLSTLTSDDWFVRSGRKYQVDKVQGFEPSMGWIVTAKELPGSYWGSPFAASATTAATTSTVAVTQEELH